MLKSVISKSFDLMSLVRPIVVMVLAIYIMIIFPGCAVVKTVHDHRVVYCDKYADAITRKAAIVAIQMKLPGYPVEGICIGIEEDQTIVEEETWL